MKSEVYKRKMDRRELLARILDAAARIKKRKDQTNNTRSSHANCKVHWCWRWDFRTIIPNCNKSVISV